MKMKIKPILVILIIVVFLSSCKIYFPNKLRKQLDEQSIELEKIQFYTSKKIILQRVTKESIVTTDTTNLKQVEETVIERIKIKRNAPGICVNAYATEIEIKFEDKDSCSLKFVLNDTTDNALYKIGALQWENGVGLVPYDGAMFYIKPRVLFFQPRSNEATLKVKRSFLKKWTIKNRKVKGLKIEKD